VDHAGITAVEHRGVIRSAVVTDGQPLVVDNIVQRYLQGACFELPRDDPICRVDDVGSETRWPVFTEKLVTSTPIRSILSVQFCSHCGGGAALNLYANRPNVFDGQVSETSLMFAAQAVSAMENDRCTRALRRKLVNRDLIGEASAMLMQRFEIDAPTAFLLLLRLSEITKNGCSRLPAACSPGIPDTVRLRRRDVVIAKRRRRGLTDPTTEATTFANLPNVATSKRIAACPAAGLPTVSLHATFEPVRLTIRHAADQEAVDSNSRTRLNATFAARIG
jgi:hypothetical protein